MNSQPFQTIAIISEGNGIFLLDPAKRTVKRIAGPAPANARTDPTAIRSNASSRVRTPFSFAAEPYI
jgi:hypothetical protein